MDVVWLSRIQFAFTISFHYLFPPLSIGLVLMIAIMEGLDYLACLLRSANFNKITSGFAKWKLKKGKTIPAGFELTTPCRTQRPTLVVLAPDSYFSGRQSRSVRGRDWPYLADIGDTMMGSVRLEFACTDFNSVMFRHPTKTKNRI